MNPRRLVAALIAACSLGIVLSPAAHAAKPGSDPLTPVIASMIPQRQVVAVPRADGRVHVLYQVLLTNSAPPPPPAAKPGSDPPTPVIASMIPQRQVVAVRGSDGRFHALYELMLTNSAPAPATLGPVRILNRANGRTVRRLSVREMLSTGAL